MMKPLLIISFLIFVGFSYGQKFSSEKRQISFFSDGAIEDIDAHNSVVGSIFNVSTGELVYIIKIRDFEFPKALMREHFNEKYLESEKFPKAMFQGKLIGFRTDAAGEQKVRAVGKLIMHGVTKEIDVPGSVEFANGKVIMKSEFIVLLKDYSIKIPTIVWQNIAEEVKVKVDITYKPM